MQTRKHSQREQIRERAKRALSRMYHNARVNFPDVPDTEWQAFDTWLTFASECEIDYLSSGGPYGTDYRATLSAPCNAGRYKSETARRFYIAKGLRAMREESAKHPAFDVREYGELYQIGRNGQTLAPKNLLRHTGGGRYAILENYADDLTLSETVKLIRTIEAFNSYVREWCASIPEQWTEEVTRMQEEATEEAKERAEWEARDVETVN